MRLRAVASTLAAFGVVFCISLVTTLIARKALTRPVTATPDAPAPRFLKHWERYSSGIERIGPRSAQDTIVMFSDFECPFCRRLALELRHLRGTDDFLLVHRNFPLSRIHPYAHQAALASVCVALDHQGDFAAYHDSLFANQDSLATVDWVRLAMRVGVRDTAKFRTCQTSRRALVAIRDDSLAAASIGGSITPIVLVNGWLFRGAPPESDIKRRLTDRR